MNVSRRGAQVCGNDAHTERLDETRDVVLARRVLEKASIAVAADNFAGTTDLKIESDEAVPLEHCNEVFESDRELFGRNVIERDSGPNPVEARFRKGTRKNVAVIEGNMIVLTFCDR